MSEKLNSYEVHLYTQIRLKVVGVQAESAAQAMQTADNAVNFHELLDHKRPFSACKGGMSVEHVEWAEEPTDTCFVDLLTETGEVDYGKSTWLDGDGKPLIDNQTMVERRAAGAEKALQFFSELLDSVETLGGIAEQHNTRTLADLMFLQQAITTHGYIDHFPGESKVFDIVSALPSGQQWLKYIRTELTASPEPLAA